ncbi:hypothetical protein AMTRI_Chr11g152610 [Amborella trichopoda]
MHILPLNIRELEMPHKKQAVRDACLKFGPSIMALTEMKMPTRTVVQVH